MSAIVLVAMVGCQQSRGRRAPVAEDAGPPGPRPVQVAADAGRQSDPGTLPAGLAELDPPRTYDLPPVPPGFRRIDRFDVEYREGGCRVGVTPHWQVMPSPSVIWMPRDDQVHVERTVGTLRLDCGGQVTDADGESCLKAACASLRAVPHGSAFEDYPDEQPVLALWRHGGDSGVERTSVDVFADGTVQYHGYGCPRWRGRHGRMKPGALDALLAAIDASGFMTFLERPEQQEKRLNVPDEVYRALWVQGAEHTAGANHVRQLDEAVNAVRASLLPDDEVAPCHP